jgi:formylglycine-generating enzyme required for sulfatase activity
LRHNPAVAFRRVEDVLRTDAFKYRAFISYSHADSDWAKWLHRAIESYPIGKDLAGRFTERGEIPSALRPVFRERRVHGGRWLKRADAGSARRLAGAGRDLLANAAKSRYVNEEVRLFKSGHPDRLVIPLIVDGRPGDPERECFPPALRFRVGADGGVTDTPVELLAADAREEADGKDLALAKIVVAGLLGLPSDEVFRRAERERRAAARRRRRVQAMVGGLALLLAAGGVVWVNQDYLQEQYRWRFVMGSKVLSAHEERALKAGDEFTECATGWPTMVVVPAGNFMMGATEEAVDIADRPKHEVSIARAFAVGKCEVTYVEWDACVAAGDCRAVTDLGWGRGERPATNVSWHDTKKYVAWLSRISGKPYRLLTEAEWEFAARAGTSTTYSFGDDPNLLGEHAWYIDNASQKSQPVGQKKPNPFGFHDMHGNLWEWVEDVWHLNYEGAPVDGSAWVAGGDASRRVLRGGAIYNYPDLVRSAQRSAELADRTDVGLGFRVARTLDQ